MNIKTSGNSYVYILTNPATGKPFYIGKGTKKRCYQHVSMVRAGKTPNNNKHLASTIKKVLKESGRIDYRFIARDVSSAVAECIEQSAIDLIGLENLTNLCAGGASGFEGGKHNSMTRALMSVQRSRPYPAFRNVKTGEFIPAGENLKAMALSYGLFSQGFCAVIHGRRKSYKGWVVA